eukprot:CAMPEP_0176169794 /NCGR_PEP_ID=MMETSP0120_2-20121206/86924_1 /TAXON_ID=160619 /ORGANISM="Kryptoperidinium foliaceum, Strain CCMP 1326" /LENGTH=34 /DNA_ID= /DNA_START= /DNA_END= /DNA_ORIENTATION=
MSQRSRESSANTKALNPRGYTPAKVAATASVASG